MGISADETNPSLLYKKHKVVRLKLYLKLTVRTNCRKEKLPVGDGRQ